MIICISVIIQIKEPFKGVVFFKKSPLKHREYTKCADADSTSPCALSKPALNRAVSTRIGARRSAVRSRGQNVLGTRKRRFSVSLRRLQLGAGLTSPGHVSGSVGAPRCLAAGCRSRAKLSSRGPGLGQAFLARQGPLAAVPCDAGGRCHAQPLCARGWE